MRPLAPNVPGTPCSLTMLHQPASLSSCPVCSHGLRKSPFRAPWFSVSASEAINSYSLISARSQAQQQLTEVLMSGSPSILQFIPVTGCGWHTHPQLSSPGLGSSHQLPFLIQFSRFGYLILLSIFYLLGFLTQVTSQSGAPLLLSPPLVVLFSLQPRSVWTLPSACRLPYSCSKILSIL